MSTHNRTNKKALLVLVSFVIAILSYLAIYLHNLGTAVSNAQPAETSGMTIEEFDNALRERGTGVWQNGVLTDKADTDPEAFTTVIDPNLNLSYQCPSQKANDIRNELRDLHELNRKNEQRLQDTHNACLDDCNYFRDEMKSCSTKSCLDDLKEDGEACIESCAQTFKEQQDQNSTDYLGLGKQVYEMVKANCHMTN